MTFVFSGLSGAPDCSAMGICSVQEPGHATLPQWLPVVQWIRTTLLDISADPGWSCPDLV